ncbi:helix-turn-helix domain-containing protein [Oceanicaulis alexandrii]|uniref:TetR/AcrR family transcriptional regulator n=1 Tax=Oceanicaulis alexandrii TaxID=153233 RepID=UPI0035D0E526
MKRAHPYNRDLALEAALDLFWRKGYHATSLKDLEQALSMKPGSIYAAFKSKRALYLACLDRYFHAGLDDFSNAVAQAPSYLEGLASYLRGFGAVKSPQARARACIVVKTALNATEEDAQLHEQSQIYLRRMRSEFEQCFKKAQAAGEMSDEVDPAQLAVQYQADLTALRIEAQHALDADALKWLADRKADAVLALGQTQSA